jgi:trehalose 6-phosphate phosphatase
MKVLNKDVNLNEFFHKIRRGSLLMLDYDGTMAPFVKERMQAYPYPGVKERLLSLMELKNTRIVIVSGRSLSDLEILLDRPSGLELWGSHGLERKLPNGKNVHVQAESKRLEGLKRGIKICQDHADPEYCEVKPYAVAFHWRGMDRAKASQVKASIERLWEQISLNYDLEIHPFDGGLELRPKGRNKGNVIQELLKEVSEHCDIAYLGDDLTDEEAFAALKEKGLKVLVRSQFRPTLADVYLIPPQELLEFLDRWIFTGKEVSDE